MSDDLKICEETGKVCFSSEKSARAKNQWTRKRMRVYQCQHCWLWHATFSSIHEKGKPSQVQKKLGKKPKVDKDE